MELTTIRAMKLPIDGRSSDFIPESLMQRARHARKIAAEQKDDMKPSKTPEEVNRTIFTAATLKAEKLRETYDIDADGNEVPDAQIYVVSQSIMLKDLVDILKGRDIIRIKHINGEVVTVYDNGWFTKAVGDRVELYFGADG